MVTKQDHNFYILVALAKMGTEKVKEKIAGKINWKVQSHDKMKFNVDVAANLKLKKMLLVVFLEPMKTKFCAYFPSL